MKNSKNLFSLATVAAVAMLAMSATNVYSQNTTLRSLEPGYLNKADISVTGSSSGSAVEVDGDNIAQHPEKVVDRLGKIPHVNRAMPSSSIKTGSFLPLPAPVVPAPSASPATSYLAAPAPDPVVLNDPNTPGCMLAFNVMGRIGVQGRMTLLDSSTRTYKAQYVISPNFSYADVRSRYPQVSAPGNVPYLSSTVPFLVADGSRFSFLLDDWPRYFIGSQYATYFNCDSDGVSPATALANAAH